MSNKVSMQVKVSNLEALLKNASKLTQEGEVKSNLSNSNNSEVVYKPNKANSADAKKPRG